ncbi:hypothetical protein [Robertmurraya sp. FSL R5-0851]|uniref:hypothetical protein n=1 Tax=Robertmurraya sp. FSL R5-0851 TaxID=2921584 RepID=UPI0030FA36B3
MKYILFLCLSCSLLLTSCSDKGTQEKEKTKEEVTEEVKLLLEKGQYNNAGSLTRDSRGETENTSEIEYYNRLSDYIRLRELYDQKRYPTLIENYIDSPIKDKLLQKDIIEMLKYSFEVLINKERHVLATELYNSLDKESKSGLGDLNDKLQEIALSVKELEKNKQKQVREASSKSKIDQYLQYMKEGNYSKISLDSASNLTNFGKNFYHLSIAYDYFYNDSSINYIQGQDSLPEISLNAITEPLPEVQPYIDQLRVEINNKKQPSKNFGVKIGMTKDEVLNSSWGKPDSINTTTSAYGSSEQWVYGNGNYLYFENEVLVTIQN